MDKVVQGNPSSLYDPVVIYNGQTLEESTEDTSERKYIANSYAGIIQFHTPFSVNSSGNFSNVRVSVFEYIGKKLNEQETHEQWHTSNGLQHIELYNIENTITSQDNTSQGVTCAGFIFNTPYMLKLSKLYIHGYYKNPNGAPPSGGNTDFDIYIKIIDPVSGHVLGVSNKGENLSTTTPNPGPGQFEFNDENSPLLPKDTDFKIIFSSNNDKHDATNDKTF
jgi:hypothetical protein